MYKVGDKVQIIESYTRATIPELATGTVVRDDSSDVPYLVELDVKDSDFSVWCRGEGIRKCKEEPFNDSVIKWLKGEYDGNTLINNY